MVQANAPQGEGSQDEITQPMLNSDAHHSSSDAGVTPDPKGQQKCIPPEVIEAAASGEHSSQLPEVGCLSVEGLFFCDQVLHVRNLLAYSSEKG